MNKKILFIVKRRELVDDYSGKILPVTGECNYGLYGETNASGLYNSVRFAVRLLKEHGVNCELVQVIDNNCIDKEVTKHKPDIVFIEALWVVPEKFKILHKLHPKVKWVIRLHSEIPFLSMEGMAMDWLFEYVKQERSHNVFVSANSDRMVAELEPLLRTDITYTPNLYPLDTNKHLEHVELLKHKDIIDISCFGAIRVLKNHLIQAIAAIQFANENNKKLRFHINATRIEGKSDPVLKNIRNLFAHTDHELVEHAWMNHEHFIKLIKSMDIGMQVSFTETYNIVAADHVDNNVPMVTSSEIKFVSPLFHANPTNSQDIVCKLHRVWTTKKLGISAINKALLEYSNAVAIKHWMETFHQL